MKHPEAALRAYRDLLVAEPRFGHVCARSRRGLGAPCRRRADRPRRGAAAGARAHRRRRLRRRQPRHPDRARRGHRRDAARGVGAPNATSCAGRTPRSACRCRGRPRALRGVRPRGRPRGLRPGPGAGPGAPAGARPSCACRSSASAVTCFSGRRTPTPTRSPHRGGGRRRPWPNRSRCGRTGTSCCWRRPPRPRIGSRAGREWQPSVRSDRYDLAHERPRLRPRKPEGRRRQDDDRHQHGRMRRRGGHAGAARSTSIRRRMPRRASDSGPSS